MVSDGRHVGVPQVVRQLTQVSLLIRLCSLVLVLLSTLGSPMTWSTILGISIVGVTSFAGLMQTRLLSWVAQHPSIALVDAIILAGAVAIDGADGPLVLAAMTTALVIGLWVEIMGGAIVLVVLLSLYTLGVSHLPTSHGTGFVTLVVVPFMYVTLWLLGMTVRRAVHAQIVAQRTLQDAVVTAAASEERARLSRELHDSLAKTLQGFSLSATALTSLVVTDEDKALAETRRLQRTAAQAVAELRQVMTGLREPTSSGDLHSAVLEVCAGWAQRTGREVHTQVEEFVVTDETVRYELLAVLQEALDNVHRHAGPASAWVELSASADELTLVVRDDGVGTTTAVLQDAQAAGHAGVTGIVERLNRVGGWADITGAPGRGTTVTCTVNKMGLVET